MGLIKKEENYKGKRIKVNKLYCKGKRFYLVLTCASNPGELLLLRNGRTSGLKGDVLGFIINGFPIGYVP